VVLWIIIAKPFILILFGDKYIRLCSDFPSLGGSPNTGHFYDTGFIHNYLRNEKTVYFGVYSFFQLAMTFALNLILIPKYGVFAPAIVMAIGGVISVIFTWTIVIRHYWVKNPKS